MLLFEHRPPIFSLASSHTSTADDSALRTYVGYLASKNSRVLVRQELPFLRVTLKTDRTPWTTEEPDCGRLITTAHARLSVINGLPVTGYHHAGIIKITAERRSDYCALWTLCGLINVKT